MAPATLCRLCLCSCVLFKSLLDDSGQVYEVYEITVKYFDPKILQPKKDHLSSVICLVCWEHIKDFHAFQKSVLKAQLKLELSKKSTVLAKEKKEIIELTKQPTLLVNFEDTNQIIQDKDEPKVIQLNELPHNEVLDIVNNKINKKTDAKKIYKYSSKQPTLLKKLNDKTEIIQALTKLELNKQLTLTAKCEDINQKMQDIDEPKDMQLNKLPRNEVIQKIKSKHQIIQIKDGSKVIQLKKLPHNEAIQLPELDIVDDKTNIIPIAEKGYKCSTKQPIVFVKFKDKNRIIQAQPILKFKDKIQNIHDKDEPKVVTQNELPSNKTIHKLKDKNYIIQDKDVPKIIPQNELTHNDEIQKLALDIVANKTNVIKVAEKIYKYSPKQSTVLATDKNRIIQAQTKLKLPQQPTFLVKFKDTKQTVHDKDKPKDIQLKQIPHYETRLKLKDKTLLNQDKVAPKLIQHNEEMQLPALDIEDNAIYESQDKDVPKAIKRNEEIQLPALDIVGNEINDIQDKDEPKVIQCIDKIQLPAPNIVDNETNLIPVAEQIYKCKSCQESFENKQILEEHNNKYVLSCFLRQKLLAKIANNTQLLSKKLDNFSATKINPMINVEETSIPKETLQESKIWFENYLIKQTNELTNTQNSLKRKLIDHFPTDIVVTKTRKSLRSYRASRPKSFEISPTTSLPKTSDISPLADDDDTTILTKTSESKTSANDTTILLKTSDISSPAEDDDDTTILTKTSKSITSGNYAKIPLKTYAARPFAKVLPKTSATSPTANDTRIPLKSLKLSTLAKDKTISPKTSENSSPANDKTISPKNSETSPLPNATTISTKMSATNTLDNDTAIPPKQSGTSHSKISSSPNDASISIKTFKIRSRENDKTIPPKTSDTKLDKTISPKKSESSPIINAATISLKTFKISPQKNDTTIPPKPSETNNPVNDTAIPLKTCDSTPKETLRENCPTISNKSMGKLECTLCRTIFENFTLIRQHFQTNHPEKESEIFCKKQDENNRFKVMAQLLQLNYVKLHYRDTDSSINENLCESKTNYDNGVQLEIIKNSALTRHYLKNSQLERLSLHRRLIYYNDEFIANWRSHLECVVCQEIYTKFSLLKAHFKFTHSQHECHIVCCNLKLKDSLSIVGHIRDFHNEKTSKKEIYKIIMKNRNFSRPRKCYKCNQWFRNIRHFEKHNEKLHFKSKKRKLKNRDQNRRENRNSYTDNSASPNASLPMQTINIIDEVSHEQNCREYRNPFKHNNSSPNDILTRETINIVDEISQDNAHYSNLKQSQANNLKISNESNEMYNWQKKGNLESENRNLYTHNGPNPKDILPMETINLIDEEIALNNASNNFKQSHADNDEIPNNKKEIHSCLICSTQFDQDLLLRKHIFEKHQAHFNTDWLCKQCYRGFECRLSLQRHVTEVHSCDK